MRRNTSYIILICAIIIGFSTDMKAQVSQPGKVKSGSIYSFFASGQPVDIGLIEEESMGIFGYSYKGLSSTGFANPAFFAQSFYTSASFSISAESYNAEDNNTTSTNTLVNPNSILFAYPLIGGKLGVGVGLYPVTRGRFRIFQDGTVQNGPDQVINYNVNDQGSGGINKFEFGIAYRPLENLYIGWSPSFIFVSETKESLFISDDSSIGQQFTTFRTRGQAFGNRFGAAYNLSRLFREGDALTLGATLTLPVSISSNRTKSFDKFLGNGFQTVEIGQGNGLGDGDIGLPLEVGAGITYFPSNLTNFSLETQFQQWGSVDYDFNLDEENILKDRMRIGFGGQYHPYTKGSSKFLSKLKYSLGVNYDKGHLEFDGQNIETLLFSAGIGILSTRSRSTMDFSFHYGIRGTRNNNLVREEIIGFKLSVNLTELMFFRPKLQ